MGAISLDQQPKKQNPARADKRAATRVDTSLPVRYRCPKQGSGWKKGRSLDLSEDGVRLTLGHPLALNAEVELEFQIPRKEHLLQLRGQVTWVLPASDPGMDFQCGVSFQVPDHEPKKKSLIQYMADRLCELALQHSPDYIVEPVQTREEVEFSFRLIYKEYIARGYCQPKDHPLQYNYHVLLPESSVLLLKEQGEILGTISLIPDSPCGLPMESVFPEEIGALRVPGIKLGEIGLLTLNSEKFVDQSFSLTSFRKQRALFLLFKGMIYYSYLVAGVTDYAFGTHPKHEMLYHYIGAQTLAQAKAYPGACGNLAHLFHLNLRAGFKGGHDQNQFWRTLLSTPPPAHHFTQRYHWNTEDVREFLFEKLAPWQTLSPKIQQHFLDCYPGLIR